MAGKEVDISSGDNTRSSTSSQSMAEPSSIPIASLSGSDASLHITAAPEVSALMTTKTHSNGQQHPDHRSNKRPWCDHCNRPGHTRDKCWEIHGKPANWQPRKKNEGRAHYTQSNQDHSGASIPFSKEQIDQLCKLLNSSSVNASQTHPPNYANSTSGSCSVAKSGKLYSVINSQSMIQSTDPWIIDSGASDHMTGPIIGEDDWQC
ncbi:uncharacterized protein LOC112095597 isoform X1 [Citrus clementina]|uniref:uncharacterized protein LOC112095597 isoform X1 n=1 Tax=Citrus clementina TaxID=85681 RepID=UPI000CED6D45|nr:uncharacterized protein LOC112095597 isoform X1 [Citrus x clementina]